MLKFQPALAAASLLSLCLAACGSGGGGEPDAAPSASCIEAVDHSDLAWIQDNVFTPGCANFRQCHMGTATRAGELNLEAGMSEAEMVNVPSGAFPQFDLVEPGDPDNSYLLIIMGAKEGPIDMEIGTMPFNSPPVCQQKLDAIERWIMSLPQ